MLTFVLLVFVFNVPFNYLMIRAHSIRAGGLLYAWGIMWCPALAAIAVLKLNGRKLSELGWSWRRTKYQLMSWLIPLLYTTITYLIVWASGLGAIPNPEFVQRTTAEKGLNMSPSLSMWIYVLLMGTFGLIIQVSAALREEIGWRGFLVPELAKTSSFTVTAIVSGTAWAVLHYPSLLFSDYNGGTPAWYGILCFTVAIVAMSFVLAWLRLKSGSLWTAAILHASHNLYIQNIFTPLTRNTGKTNWFIDEFGVVLPLVIIAFAIYFWRRRAELPIGENVDLINPAPTIETGRAAAR